MVFTSFHTFMDVEPKNWMGRNSKVQARNILKP